MQGASTAAMGAHTPWASSSPHSSSTALHFMTIWSGLPVASVRVQQLLLLSNLRILRWLPLQRPQHAKSSLPSLLLWFLVERTSSVHSTVSEPHTSSPLLRTIVNRAMLQTANHAPWTGPRAPASSSVSVSLLAPNRNLRLMLARPTVNVSVAQTSASCRTAITKSAAT